MKLIFTNEKGISEVLATSGDLSTLKQKASEHYTGNELPIWESDLVGKPYNDHVPELPYSFKLENGSSYSIGK
ncbi:hypothetical protein L3081_17880 [Colwellia sp. MSW7]|jgi:hypothetical protein|uniref:Uncharacterized protein n=1 Tax=Colwellia maritima TaxID=2912588 RepID=A0ABS9X3W5_9GAMM|nr:hypothetical protein [Colwellia maritima]MCI2284918.1 hypothetical protein [Colwellia maritima]